MIGLLLLLQGVAPTVGDTIWLERRVEVPAGADVRAPQWDPEGVVELLGKPSLRREGSTAILRYPTVAWTAGTHEVSIPGPVIVRADGTSDSLPPQVIRVVVRSLLPVGAPDSLIPIQPQVGLVMRPVTSPLPIVVAALLTLVILAVAARWWRRRGPAMVPVVPPRQMDPDHVEAWVASGEGRAVAAVAVEQLRRAIGRRLPDAHPGLELDLCLAIIERERPTWPRKELGDLLRALDAARFAPVLGPESEALYAQATALGARLGAS